MKTHPTLKNPDDVYELLADAQRDLGEADRLKFDARLILLLANQVGDERVIAECIAAAARPFRGAAR
jgi:hypothetical protein